jgi:hypothetical protein
VSDVSGGTQAFAPIISLGQATITNASTNTIYTNAPTMYIGGAPSASTNVRFQRPYALYLDSGTTASATAETYTNAATLYIAGAPTAGANVTLTTPYALYVNAGNVYLGGGTANGVAYLDTNKVLTTGSALVFDGTNLGVGSASLSATSGRVDVTINGTSSSMVSFGTGGTRRGYMIHDGTDLTIANEQAAGALRWVTSAGEAMRIATATGGVNALGIGYSTLTSVGNNGLAVFGNVGIGTSSPSSKLHVSGTEVRLQGSASFYSFYDNAGTTRAGYIQNNAGALSFVGELAQPMQFYTNNTEKMRIDSSGNLGVGTTSPVYQTQIYGSGQTTAALTDSGNKGGSLLLNTPTVAGGDGGALLIGAGGAGAKPFAAIKGLLADGGGNTTGALAFSTRNATGDTSLTERARFNTTGAFVFAGGTTTADGIGITFPATQSASTNANTLDDYEEGTITGLTDGSGAGLSITFNNAKYTKIGRLVYISISTIEYPVTASGAMARIDGLPFTNTAADVGSSALVSNNANANRALVIASNPSVFFYATATAGATSNVQLSGAIIYGFSAVYQV